MTVLTNDLFLVGVDGSSRRLTSPTGAVFDAAASGGLDRLLGLREPKTLERLRSAVNVAIRDRAVSVLHWGRGDGEGLGRLLTIRPAREDGYAIVGIDALDATPSSVSWMQLHEMFGLCRSEAEIALALANDESVNEIAEARGVQLETVRGQIKSLLRKMGLSSQKQLVRVITRIAGAFHRG